eukprot:gene8366-10646_t
MRSTRNSSSSSVSRTVPVSAAGPTSPAQQATVAAQAP